MGEGTDPAGCLEERRGSITVHEEEIVAAFRQMCENGDYIEPTSSDTVTGTCNCLKSEEKK